MLKRKVVLAQDVICFSVSTHIVHNIKLSAVLHMCADQAIDNGFILELLMNIHWRAQLCEETCMIKNV